MKTRIIVLSLLLSIALGVSARVFETGDVIYVKMEPTNWNWYGTNPDDGKFAYFFKSGSSSCAWSEEAIGVPYCDDVLQIKVPAGDWTHIIMTRNSVHSGPNWSNVYNNGDDNTVNKSADIQIPDNQNYLDNFRQYKDANDHPSDKWHWSDCYFYRPSANPTSPSVTKIDKASRELVEVCTQSVGDPFSLQPRLISATAGYDYNQGRTWFKWVGGQWKEMHNANSEWGFNGTDGLNETIGAAGSHTYYFLSTKDTNKQRFIEVAVTKDCSPTCEITDFGVVTSSVNAHDSTYVLDGIVAFKSANGKTLRISVTDAKGEHYVEYVNPSTPLIFSLPGLFADGTQGLKATATFVGTSYSRTSKPYTAPNAIIGIHTNNLNQTYGKTTTFTPSTTGEDGFKWHDGNTTDHERVIPAYGFDTTIIYTYYEYEPAPTVAGNLIENGDFSANPFDYGTANYASTLIAPFSTISDYHYWGKDVTSSSDFYVLKGNITGGMAIVKDANKFWKRFTKTIQSKRGDHFALFDADNSGEKAAWKVETNTLTHANLKLAKGTNYMFSFWVANINNYGEMNNAAKLQFEISYSQDNGSTWSTPEKLGNPIDLNNYPDNLWHQNSHVYASKVNANKVRISVKDLNTNSNPGGNDFALDDIQFQPISVVSQAIKNCERFVLDIYEPAITVNQPTITITQTPACGKTDFGMQVNVSYSTLNNIFPVTLQLTDNVYGPIFTIPISIDPLTNPNNITIDLSTTAYAMLVADGQVHTLTATLTRLNAAGVDKGGQNSNTYTSPGIPTIHQPVLQDKNKGCDKVTFDLEVTTEYLAFKGTQLHYDWDGTEWTNTDKPTLSYKEATWQTATGTMKSLPADGQPHTLRVYSDNAALDCEYTFADWVAPHSPQITVIPQATVLPFICDDAQYQVKVETNFTNGQGRNLIFEDWTGAKQTVATAVTDTYKDCTFAYGWENPTNHTFKVYFEGAEECADNHIITFTSPFLPTIETVTLTGVPTLVPCDATAYEITVAVTPHFSPVPAGKQIILTYDSVGDTKTTAPIALADFPHNLIIHNIANDKHSVFAAFADAPDCKAEAKYDAPERETCYRDTFTICDGGSYWWHEAYRTGPVGENKFADGKDSLFLFVKEKPTISIGTIAMTCDEANVVRIPFSVAKGNPDNFDIDIVGSHFPGTLDIVGTDTAFVFTPATMEAGDYAAHVTVGETDVPCTSTVDINFTIAISGQMYSKWTDVLFIGNKEGRYTGYQWFADGAAMGGETLQYLYDPKGLSGTAILYHCRLTTTDGKTLYTCPQTFDDVTPSRTVTTTPAQVKSTTMYDTMGRVIKGTPHNGIYIVSEELENGEIRTRKITIYE